MVDNLTVRKAIRIQEYGPSRDFHFTEGELNELLVANSRWKQSLGLPRTPIRIEAAGSGKTRLRAEGVTGVVRVGDTDIEIVPKFLDASIARWQMALWRILSFAEGGGVVESPTSGLKEKNESLPEVLADIFLRSFWRGSVRGFPNAYAPHRSEGTMLRGSFDTTRLAQWTVQPWQVPYRTDFLTEDSPITRLIKWSATALSRLVHTPSRIQGLRLVTGSLSHISNTRPSPEQVRKIRLSAQYRALEPAIVIGRLLLDGTGLGYGEGDFFVPGFLWNSDVVYERFLFRICQHAASKFNISVDKNSVHFGIVISGDATRLQTIPDIVFREQNGNVIAVADSKYKKLGSRPRSNDSYQVITAAHVLGCRKVALIFPSAAQVDPATWRVSSLLGAEDIFLTALPVDLTQMAHSNGIRQLSSTISEWLSRHRYESFGFKNVDGHDNVMAVDVDDFTA